MTSDILVNIRFKATDETSPAISRIKSKLAAMERSNVAFAKNNAKVAASAAAFQRSIIGINRQMLAMAGVASVPAALVLGLKSVTNAAGDFEESLFQIKKKSGATREEIEGLRGEMMGLAKEVPVSLDEIAKAYERGAAAGIPLDELRDFAKLTVQVADAWDMTAEDVANAFAGFEKGMGIPRDELEGLADAINYLADSGISDEKDIVNFLDRVGANAQSVGIAARNTAAFGAALVNLKMPPEVAARAFNSLLSKLIAPENLSPKSRSALQKITGDVEQFRKVMGEDPNKGLLFFFDKLEKLTGQQRMSLLGALMGEGFSDEVSRMAEGLGQIKEMLEAVQQTNKYEGSIAGLSDQRLELYKAKVKQLQAAFENLKVTIGEDVLPMAKDVIDWARDGIDTLREQKMGADKFDALGGMSTDDATAQMLERYRKLNPDASTSEILKLIRRDVANYGGGRTKSIFAGINEAERRDRDQKAARKAFSDPRYAQAVAEMWPRGQGMPVPTPRPVPLSEAEQRALYGQGRADREHALRRKVWDRFTPDEANAPLGAPAFTNMPKLSEDADKAAASLAQGGAQAGQAMKAAGPEVGQSAAGALLGQASGIGAAIGQAAGAAIRAAIAGASVRVNADVGRSGRDVTAPATGGGE
jgi:TP901 family phage tail tape measure protein